MSEPAILLEIGFVVAAAAVAGLLARPLRVPPLVAYMLAGVVLGPLTGLVHVTDRVELISEVGVALLLFLVGLELSIGTVRDVGRAAVLAGGGQALLTALAGFGLSLLLGFRGLDAAFIAVALTFSSTVVVIKLLEQRGELKSVHGRIAVGVLLVQDLIAVVVLTLLAGAGASGALTAGAARGLALAAVGMVALAAAALLVAKGMLPRLFGWLSQSPDALFVTSLAWCFAFMVGASVLGLSVEMGAFLAGVGLAQLPYNHELQRRVQPLASFFIAVFFVSLGLHMQPGALLSRPWAVLALSVTVLFFKPAMLAGLLPRLGIGERSTFLATLSLAQISEFSFIIVTLAERAGLVSTEVLSIVGLVGLITISISTVAIGNGPRMYRAAAGAGWLRILRAPVDPPARDAPRRGHIIVVGMNTLGLILVRELTERGEAVLAIDTDLRKLRGLDIETMVGHAEHPSVLRDADLPTAKLLVSTLQIEDANVLLAFRCREAGVPCSIHAFDPLVTEELRALAVAYPMVSKHDGIRQVAEALRRAGVIA